MLRVSLRNCKRRNSSMADLAILHRKGFATDMKLEESEKLVATLKKVA